MKKALAKSASEQKLAGRRNPTLLEQIQNKSYDFVFQLNHQNVLKKYFFDMFFKDHIDNFVFATKK